MTKEAGMRQYISFFGVTVILFVQFLYAHDIEIHPGMWKIETHAHIVNGNMDLPAVIYEKYIEGSYFLPNPSRYGESCRTVKTDRKSKQLTWRIECNNDDIVSIERVSFYSYEWFESNVSIIKISPYGNRNILLNRITGKYKGHNRKNPTKKADRK